MKVLLRQDYESLGERGKVVTVKGGYARNFLIPRGIAFEATSRNLRIFEEEVRRGEAMKRFLVEEGVGRNPLFWRLAQALSALYPAGADEKRWVDGVLARKKGLGF